MKLVLERRTWITATLVMGVLMTSVRVSAQSLNGDARDVGLGGFEHASRLLYDTDEPTFQFVVPLGLLQMAGDWRALRPGSGQFDPTIALEYAAVPAHFVIGRQPSAARARFIDDIRQAGLNRDLNSYRGFKPAASLEGAGLLSPTWGKSFAIPGAPGRFAHRIYVGAGPYLSIETAALFDQRLVNLLGASSAVYEPSSTLDIGNRSIGQVAAQFTGGYRGQWRLAAFSGSTVDFEATYNHLQGFRYENLDLNLRLDTDAAGLVALDRGRGAPMTIDRHYSSSGRGLAVDLATTATVGRWRFSLRSDGIGNRIDWTGVTRRGYELATLTDGSSRVQAVRTEATGDIRERLPVSTRLQSAYLAGRWGAIVDLQHGFQGTTAGAALERRFNGVEVRGGARLVNRVVLPAAGVSVKVASFWIDLGAAMSTANIERQRNVVLASSLRFGRRAQTATVRP